MLRTAVLKTSVGCMYLWELKHTYSQLVTCGLSRDRLVNFRLRESFSSHPSGRSIRWARVLFNQTDNPTVCLCNSVIKSLLSMHAYEDALKIYGRMLHEGMHPDSYTFPCVLKAIVGIRDELLCQKVHAHIVKLGLGADVYTCNTLIVTYASFSGWIEQARQVFDEMPQRSTVSWTVMINGYSKVGEAALARMIFDEANEKDVVLWGAMISCYVHNNCFREGLQTFRLMQASRMEPDEAVLVSVLVACAQLGALDLGRWIHSYLDRKGIKISIRLSTALLDMYAKCGLVDVSKKIFDSMPQRDVVCWNSMIMALSIHGDAWGALKLFSQMEKYGLWPDDITFIAVLTACSHAGLVGEGRQQFERMSKVYGIQPKEEHYTCMVDGLSRAGFVDEAWKLLRSMLVCNPGEALAWRALLSASLHHGDIRSAELAAGRLVQLEPHTGVYSLLSNIYAMAGKFGESEEIKKLMKETGVQKAPGCSSIVIDGFIHEFVAGGKAHPHIEEITYNMGENTKRFDPAWLPSQYF